MTRSFHVQGYSDRDVVAMPSADYRSMLEFARRMGVTTSSPTRPRSAAAGPRSTTS